MDADGEEAEDVRNFAGLLRPGGSCTFNEGGSGSQGRRHNLFHQGAARKSEDPRVIAATMAAPSVVLKRPVGSSGPFKEHDELPTDLVGDGGSKKAGRKSAIGKPYKHQQRADAKAVDRKAALAFEKEQKRRGRERAKRPPGKRSGNGGSAPSTRQKAPSTQPVESTKETQRALKPNLRFSRKNRGPKKRVGGGRRPGWKPRDDERKGRLIGPFAASCSDRKPVERRQGLKARLHVLEIDIGLKKRDLVVQLVFVDVDVP